MAFKKGKVKLSRKGRLVMRGRNIEPKLICLSLILILVCAGGIALGQIEESPSPEELYDTALSEETQSPKIEYLGPLPEEELYQAAHGHYLEKNYDQAISGFKAYLFLFPRSSKASDAMCFLGSSYYWQGNYLQAIKEFQAAIRDYPESESAWLALYLGSAYERLKDYAQAFSVYQEAIVKYPQWKDQFLSSIEWLAGECKEAGQKDQAIHVYRGLVRLNPEDYRYHRVLADLYKDVAQLDQAIAEYKEALRLLRLYPKELPEEDIKLAELVDKQIAEIAGVLLDLGITYHKKIEELQKAEVEAYQEAIKVYPGHVFAHYNLGVLFYNKSIGETGTEKRALRRQAREQFLLVIGYAKENPEEQELKIKAQELIRVIDYWL